MRKILSLILVILMIAPMSFAEMSAEQIMPTCYAVEDGIFNNANEVRCQPFEPRIDVVFVIDSTGSMADEIRSVKTHIINLVDEVRSGQPSPKLRVGVVTYRDHEREEHQYLLRTFQLTSDVDEALDFIRSIEASGGGDGPEAVADGLHSGVNDMNWDKRAKRLVFLIGDASPHGVGSGDSSYHQGCPDGHNYKEEIERANQKGITIYTISGSGMDYIGQDVWQTIAYKTGGDYEQLSYVRRVVEDYYQEEGIDDEWVVQEAKASADYDAGSNTILTNTLGRFAKFAVKAEAAEMGVAYDDPETYEDYGPDAYDDTVEPADTYSEDDFEPLDDEPHADPVEETALARFFRNVFRKLAFWK